MSIHNINRRLDKLNALHPAETPPRRVISLIVEEDMGETQDEAMARWCAENPNEPPPSGEDFIILHRIVSPKPQRPRDGDPHNQSAPR